MSTQEPQKWVYLVPNPSSSYKQLFVKGTRIRAEALYAYTVDGPDESEFWTPEQVAAEFNLPLEAVREAIRYCETHSDVIAQDHRREEARMEATGADRPDARGRALRHLSAEEMARLRSL